MHARSGRLVIELSPVTTLRFAARLSGLALAVRSAGSAVVPGSRAGNAADTVSLSRDSVRAQRDKLDELHRDGEIGDETGRYLWPPDLQEPWSFG
jgi:hypothetical protein